MAPGFVKSQKHLPCFQYSQSIVFLLGSKSSLIRRCKSLFPIVHSQVGFYCVMLFLGLHEQMFTHPRDSITDENVDTTKVLF